MREISKIELIGNVVPGTIKKVSHKLKTFDLAVKRKSGTDDIISVLTAQNIESGTIHVLGELHSSINSELHVYVFARTIEPDEGNEHMNKCVLSGCVCSAVSLRITQNDRTVSSTTLASHALSGYHCYVPIIFWGRNAEKSLKYNKGDKLSLKGRLQSRKYFKHGEQKVTYEVSVSSVKEK